MAKNVGAKGFWRRMKNQLEADVYSPTPEVPAEPTPEEPAEPVETEAAAPAAKAEAPLPSPAAASESLAEVAARLAAEQEEKRNYAQAAAEEAKRAEAALRRLEKETALKQAEVKAQTLQKAGAQAQQKAANALQELSRVEQAHTLSVKEAEQKAAEARSAKAQAEEALNALQAENRARLDRAQAALTQLAEALAAKQAEREQTLQDQRRAEEELEQAEMELLQVQNEGNDLLHKLNKSAQDARGEIDVVTRQIAILEERIENEQKNYQKLSERAGEAEEQLNRAEQRVRELEEQRDRLQNDSADSLQAQLQGVSARLEDAKAAVTQAEESFQEAQMKEGHAQEDVDRFQGQYDEGQQKLRTLSLEKEENERQLQEKLQEVLDNINQSREDVSRKKDAYQQAQKKMETTTTELVRLNAQAKTAKERLDRAKSEEQDAQVAFDMAQRLRADAMTARSGADEVSSQLLNKAESVLLNTIDSTKTLLAEKVTQRENAEQEFNRQNSLAASADAASKEASTEANGRLLVWLAAEENFVKTTGDVEAERARLELQLETLREGYEDKQKALAEQVTAWDDQAHEARRQLESAAMNTRARRQDLQVMQSRLDNAEDEYRREEERLRKALDDQLADCGAELTRAKGNANAARAQMTKARGEQEKQSAAMKENLDGYMDERKHYQALLEEKNTVSGGIDQKVAATEGDYKARIYDMNQRIDGLTQTIRQAKEAVAAIQESILDLEKQQAETESDYETLEKSCADDLASLQTEQEKQLSPLDLARTKAEDRTAALAERLVACRTDAEKAVRLAAETFTERLAAVNNVSVCRVENQIAVLKESALPLQKNAKEERSVLDAAEEVYQRLHERVVALRGEEEAINNDADAKYQQLDAETAATLADREQQLKDCTALAEERDAALEKARQALEAATQRLTEAEKDLVEAEHKRDAADRDATLRLAELDEEYHRRLSEAYADLPKYLEDANRAAAAVAEQQVAADEAEEAFRQQNAAVEQYLQEELMAPQALNAAVENLRAQKQANLNDAQTRLSVLEEKQRALQASYKDSCDCAEKAEQAKIEVEAYLTERRQEQAQEEDRVNAQIQSMEEQLALLKEDAIVKERAYRQAEKMLEGSSTMLQNASTAYSNAQVAAAKAQAELQSSQAAKETATALAKQASTGHDGMDESTAVILRKAAEGLLSAVSNAEALIAEKQIACNQANEDLRAAQAELERVRVAIGEAPAQLETSRIQWEKSEKEYAAFREKANQEIPALQKELAEYVAARQADLASAEEAVRSSREEAASSQAGAEKLNRQLMELAAEITAAANEVQTIQLDMTEAIADLENENEKMQATRKEERIAAQELAAQYGLSLEENRDRLQRLREEAQDKAKLQQQKAAEYQRFEGDLTDRYQQDQNAAQQVREDAVAAALEKAKTVADAQDAWLVCREAFENAQSLHTESAEQKARLTADCEDLRRNREQSLRAVAEDKLRMLGAKTIERINAEDQAAHALADCQSKRSRCLAAEQKVVEVENVIQAEEEKLARLREESEKALEIARTKTSIFA